MSDRDLMQQALDAMMTIRPYEVVDYDQLEASITALRERLAQPVQELVCVCGAIWESQELVSAPSQRQWQGLTDQEINSVCYKRDWTAPWTDVTFARAIEAKLREKNHG